MKEKLQIELIVGDGKPLVNASVPVRWCINKETLTKIKDENGEYGAMVLIIALDEKGHESRMLAPLSQGMGYLNLNRAGINKIYGLIVYNPKFETKNYIKHQFLNKINYSRYAFEMNYDENEKITPWYNKDDMTIIACEEYVTVDIPKELFGKEPAPWFKDMVNYWQDTHIDDQCAWRRRLLFFVFVKSWVMLIASILSLFLFTSMVFFLVLFGFKIPKSELAWFKRPLLNFGNIDPTSLKNIACGSNGELDVNKLAMLPIIHLICIWFFWCLSYSVLSSILLGIGFAILTPLLVMIVYQIALKCILACNWLVNNVFGCAPIIRYINKHLDKKRDRLIDRDKLIAKQQYKQSEDYLSCKACDTIASVALVPRQNMTIRLRYEHIKNSICKPMMR